MKRIGKSKRVATLGLIFLLSINSFATSIANNDGSAFITKAEFDALKSTFQSQVDKYNQNIDSKIDNAIASYLSGININHEPQNTWKKLVDGAGEDIWFANTLSNSTGYTYSTTWGSSSNVAALNINAERHYSYDYTKMKYVIHGYGDGNTVHRIEVAIVREGSTAIKGFSTNSLAYAQGGGNGTEAWDYTQDNLGAWMQGSRADWSESSYKGNVSNIWDASTVNNAGSGIAWIYHKRPDGKLILKEYATKICPAQTFDFQYHSYKNKKLGNSTSSFDNWKSWYTVDNGLGDVITTKPTINVPKISTWETDSSGTKKSNDDTTSSSSYYKYDFYSIKNIINKYFNNIQFGKTPTNTIYCLSDDVTPSVGTQASKTVADSTFNSVKYGKGGAELQSNTLTGYNFTYYPLYFTPETKKLTDFIHEQISLVAGDIVELGGGAPLANILDNYSKINIKLKFKCRNSATNASVSSGTVSFQISDKKFVSGGLSSGAANLLTVTDAPLNTQLQYTIDVPLKGIIWINMYSNSTGNDVTLGSFDVELSH